MIRFFAVAFLSFAIFLFSACSPSADVLTDNSPLNLNTTTPPKNTEQILAELPNPPLPTKTLTIDKPQKDIVFTVEIADTDETKKKGLMARLFLQENHGMFFVFDQEAPLSFWMKNMKFSLDLIFLDKDMRIVDIIPYVPPCRVDPCLNYKSKAPAQYVLEIDSGKSDVLGIAIGDRAYLE